MSDCLFCKIAAGEIPADKVYEDDRVIAFKDINPHAPVHDLIVPRRHIRSVNDLKEQDSYLVGHLLMVGRDLAGQRGVNESGYKLVFNVEWGGGQRIFHIHMHLLGGWVDR